MKITAKKVEMLLEDESGYKFMIQAQEIDAAQGWNAHVSIWTMGLISAEATLPSLLGSAKQLVRMLENEVKEEDR